MIKVKIEKYEIISFIGLIVLVLVVFGGNLVLQAGSPSSAPKTEVNFENRLQSLEDGLETGNITQHEYDSLSDLLRIQIRRNDALKETPQKSEIIPEWATKLGISAPVAMLFDPDFSDYTSVDDPSDGFNSVSLVYSGSYNTAIEEAARIAADAKLSVGGIFKSKGSPVKSAVKKSKLTVSYMNYSLDETDLDYLISVRVEPSGR